MKLPFQPVTLTFKGEDYTVPPENVWGLIGTIENVITRTKLVIRIHERDIPEAKIAEAFAAALTYAGAKNIRPHDITIGADPMELFGHALALFAILNLAIQPEGFAKDGDAPGEAKSPAMKASAKPRSKSGARGG